jgi:nucleoside-diphosphate-sugar epimerase
MVVLVTGASGFLGRRLAEMLLSKGETVRLLVRETSRLDLRGLESCEIVRVDFSDMPVLVEAMRGVRVVHHCAGLSSDWGSWDAFRAANIEMVATMLNAAHRAGSVERFVHVSTTDIYGYPEEACGEAYGFHDSGLPYNRSKGEGDRLALEFHARTGLPVTVVRPATIFGPRAKDWVIELTRLLRAGQALTIAGGGVPAGLVYVDDVAGAMMALAEAPEAIGQAYNVVDPERMSWRDYMDRFADALGVRRARFDMGRFPALILCLICETVYRLLGMKSRPLFTRHLLLLLTRDQQFPIGKLTAVLPGFPAVGLRDGLSATLDWVRSDLGRLKA